MDGPHVGKRHPRSPPRHSEAELSLVWQLRTTRYGMVPLHIPRPSTSWHGRQCENHELDMTHIRIHDLSHQSSEVALRSSPTAFYYVKSANMVGYVVRWLIDGYGVCVTMVRYGAVRYGGGEDDLVRSAVEDRVRLVPWWSVTFSTGW